MRTQADRDDDLAIGRQLERKDAEIDRLRAVLTNIVACTHRPNPTDLSRIDVAPGKYRGFQAAIEDAMSALEQKADDQ